MPDKATEKLKVMALTACEHFSWQNAAAVSLSEALDEQINPAIGDAFVFFICQAWVLRPSMWLDPHVRERNILESIKEKLQASAAPSAADADTVTSLMGITDTIALPDIQLAESALDQLKQVDYVECESNGDSEPSSNS